MRRPRPRRAAADTLEAGGTSTNNGGYCVLTFAGMAQAQTALQQVNPGGAPMTMPNSARAFVLAFVPAGLATPPPPTSNSNANATPTNTGTSLRQTYMLPHLRREAATRHRRTSPRTPMVVATLPLRAGGVRVLALTPCRSGCLPCPANKDKGNILFPP
ncbi:hypothetical protein B0H15DRAFT_952227 [Mycena belliarum]|uniref:Uncharacterized protein n=1 Tax=Mycena belliarum TaxID=1033014 RepID=A0AAD6U1K1_9AGAR|nr:hypothetical protein B0H15DRAFT_952227 [Mycena belliae]